ncbi:MAG TPA: TldD/PmbA family protein [Blastocatellia bacterium]|nr:TldD/PmbA family protein [Blastocatellia bacterium]
MTHSRRDFLCATGAAAGALALPTWMQHAQAEEEPPVDRAAIADAAMDAARKAGASYADIRINRYRNEAISTRERQVQNVSRNYSFGFGVRALYKGAWGFAASRIVTPQEARRVTQQAVEIARANAQFQPRPVRLAPAAKVVTSWRSAFEQDPFDAPLDDKIQFLLKLNERALSVKGVRFVNSQLSFVNEQKYFASTDGSRIEQNIMRGWPTFTVTAVDQTKGDFQTRTSLPSGRAMGLEYLSKFPWLDEAEAAGHEAVEKLKAKTIASGKYDLVLAPSHLFLTIHESVGHSTELDRALGWEADYAGTSFLTPDKTGKFQFGSKLVNFYADRTEPTALATVGYDDEGVPGQRWDIVKNGVFVDWQTTRELAPLIGRKTSYGCLHADSWDSVPFPRMPNVSLAAAKETVSMDDLIADVKDGLLMFGRGTYSIDQQRYNFQFGSQTCYEIKNGKRGAMVREAVYQSRTPDFWAACDGLGGASTFELGGTFSDGKGQPGQVSAVSHGCPPARFRQINVLNTARE